MSIVHQYPDPQKAHIPLRTETHANRNDCHLVRVLLIQRFQLRESSRLRHISWYFIVFGMGWYRVDSPTVHTSQACLVTPSQISLQCSSANSKLSLDHLILLRPSAVVGKPVLAANNLHSTTLISLCHQLSLTVIGCFLNFNAGMVSTITYGLTTAPSRTISIVSWILN